MQMVDPGSTRWRKYSSEVRITSLIAMVRNSAWVMRDL
jgi:hypothetical protein